MDERAGNQNGGRNDVSAAGQRIAREAEEELRQLQDRFSDVNQRVVGFIRERPGTALVIALGAGFLVGRLLRS